MYAVIKTGGKQFKVAEGDEIFVEKLDLEEGTEFEITEVLALNNGQELTVDAESLAKAKVAAKVVKNGKSKKIMVFTYKAKKNKKRKMGHRQLYTKLQIMAIKKG